MLEPNHKYVITDGSVYAETYDVDKFTTKIQNGAKWREYDVAIHALNHAKKRKDKPISGSFKVQEINMYPLSSSPDVLAHLYDIKTFVDLVENCRMNSDAWNEELSRIDRELCDVYHFIEMESFSASSGFRLSKRIKELREKRRQIKDYMNIANCLNNISSANLESIRSMLSAFNNRTYTPREVDFSEIV